VFGGIGGSGCAGAYIHGPFGIVRKNTPVGATTFVAIAIAAA
jgi:hypothetical protein